MDEAREPRQRDGRGRLLPVEHPTDYSRYAMGEKTPATRAAKAAYRRGERAKTSQAPPRERLTVEIHFRVTEDTAAALDALTEGKGTRNTTARGILLSALEAGPDDKQQGSEER